MSRVRVPDESEEQIMRENGLIPGDFGVTYRDADTIRLLNYSTRDIVTIWRGDRKW